MTIIRVFPRRTSQTPRDRLAFVGDPPMEGFRPEADEVHVSVTFTWDIDAGHRLVGAWRQYYDRVLIGGPAMGDRAGSFIAGRYVRPGVTFTSRGCYHHCAPCLVPTREGRLRELADFPPGNIVQDDNLLQCSPPHLSRVWAMLRGQSTVKLAGGIDPMMVTDGLIEDLQGISIKEVFLSCDNREELPGLRRAAYQLRALERERLRCFVLLAYEDETVSDATARLEDVWKAGCIPFAMLYQPPDKWIDYSPEWKRLQKHWTRPAFTKMLHGWKKGDDAQP